MAGASWSGFASRTAMSCWLVKRVGRLRFSLPRPFTTCTSTSAVGVWAGRAGGAPLVTNNNACCRGIAADVTLVPSSTVRVLLPHPPQQLFLGDELALGAVAAKDAHLVDPLVVEREDALPAAPRAVERRCAPEGVGTEDLLEQDDVLLAQEAGWPLPPLF